MNPLTTAAETLKAAKAKIEDPENWCQGFYACDADGKNIYSCDPRAHSWCAIGAVYSTGPNVFVISYLCRAAEEDGYKSAALLNDATTHENVMKMYDRAIEFAEEDKVT